VFKNQIDWIPLSSGSVRPTQGRTLAIAQVSGGSQSFNTVNALRVLGRWMRMFVIPNQSSIPKAYTQFTDPTNSATGEVDVAAEGGSRLRPSGNRDRIVDCMEELVKYTLIMRHHFDLFNDRFSERAERQANYDRSATNKAEQAQAGGEGNVKTVGSADVVNGIDVAGI
jgi:arsenic resistance protein ArsH